MDFVREKHKPSCLGKKKKSETGREKTPVESLQGMLEHMQGYLKRPVAFARPLVYKKNHG